MTTMAVRAGGPALALRPVSGVAVGTVVVLLALAGRYGYHRDELYFRVLADAPAWGCVDQPPLTPLIARWSIDLLGDEVWALRVPAALLAGTLAVLLALVAREVGGGRLAQTEAALGAASATPLVSGHILLTSSLDWPLWVLVSLFVMRALLRGQPQYWVAAGAVAGLALSNKLLILLLLFGLLVGLLVAGPRRRLADRWLRAGVGAVLLLGSPRIAYQLANGLPQARMVDSLTGDAARLIFLPMQALAIGPPAVPVWAAGLWALTRRPELRPVRCFAVAYLAVCLLLIALAGQFHYTVGLLLVLWAVGAMVAEGWVHDFAERRRERLGRLGRLVGVNVVTSAIVALPVLPLGILGATPVPLINPAVGDQVGWERYTAQVADAYRSLPQAERDRAVLIADNYGEAGALDRYGPELGLPPVVSGHNGNYDLGRPPEGSDVAVVLMQGEDSAAFLGGVFASCAEEAAGQRGRRAQRGAGHRRQGVPRPARQLGATAATVPLRRAVDVLRAVSPAGPVAAFVLTRRARHPRIVGGGEHP